MVGGERGGMCGRWWWYSDRKVSTGAVGYSIEVVLLFPKGRPGINALNKQGGI